MRTLLDERFAPITSSIGFLAVPLQQAVDGWVSWHADLGHRTRVTPLHEPLPEALSRLLPLTNSDRPRELLVQVRGGWCAYFDCLMRGTDPLSIIVVLAPQLRCQGLVVESAAPRAARGGRRRGSGPALGFSMFAPTPTSDFGNTLRSESAVNDGSHWRFSTHGAEQPFEDIAQYRAPRVAQRFTSDMLERYCRNLGLDVFNPDAYGPAAALLQTKVGWSWRRRTASLAEAQQSLGIEPGRAAPWSGPQDDLAARGPQQGGPFPQDAPADQPVQDAGTEQPRPGR